jgi:flagellar motor switch protein FliN/FliY
MSDGSLSQDEIDALLQGSGGMDFGGGGEQPSGGGAVTSDNVESFRQIVAETVETQQSNLSMLLGSDVNIEGPQAELGTADDVQSRFSGNVVVLNLDFSEGVAGSHAYVMNAEAATSFAGAVMGQEEVDLDDAAINALQEAFSQVSGTVVTTLGDKASASIMTSPPEGQTTDAGSMQLPGGNLAVLSYRISVANAAPMDVVEVYDAGIVSGVVGGGQQQQPQQQPAAAQSAGGGGGGGQDPFAGLGFGGGSQQGGGGGQGQGPSVQPVQFPGFQSQSVQGEQGNISLLMDVYMEMTVELGRTKKLIKEILGMGEGTIIELDKLAGEPVDILVNHKLIAKGEVVVIDENFGVRVTEIVSPMERVSNMT